MPRGVTHMKKAVIYARFSSHSQNEQSIEGQLKECLAFAERNGMRIIGDYIDRALTGTTDKRPEFLRMVEESKKQRFEFVIVYQLDRFARNRYDSATYKAKLKKNGVRVLSAKENITDDPSGILIEGVLESMAEYYSAELSQKVKRGVAISASKLRFTGGAIPLGYRIDENKHYQINESEAPYVVKIYEMYASGKTGVEIFKFLNDQQLKTTRGGTWNKSSLNRILVNRRYLGYYICGEQETKGGIPQIVNEELFEQVQQQMTRNKKAPSARKAEDAYILTTKLYCGLCGSLITGVSGTSRTGEKHYYYKCFGYKQGCKKKNIQKILIEDAVIEDTLKLLDDEVIDNISKALHDLLQEELKSGNISRLEKLLSDNKRAIENLMKVLMDGKATDLILAKLDQLQKEQKDIEQQLETERTAYLDFTLPQIRRYVKRFKHLDYSVTANRQALIDTFVNKVYLSDDGKSKIRYNVTDFHSGSFLERMVGHIGLEPTTPAMSRQYSPN